MKRGGAGEVETEGEVSISGVSMNLVEKDAARAKKSIDVRVQEFEQWKTDTIQRAAELWGPEPEYHPNVEDKANVFSQLSYTWIGETIMLAAKERLTPQLVPPPCRGERAHECGSVLSAALLQAVFQRASWEPYLGCNVRHKAEPRSIGVLKWVGVPQQGEYAKVLCAGVEWSRPPTFRTAQHEEDEETTPFHNGVVWGEHLFVPTHLAASTLEPVEDVEVLLPNGTPIPAPTPKKIAFMRTLVNAMPGYLYWQIPPKLIEDSCTLLTPVILEKFISFLNSSEHSWSDGLLLVVAFFSILVVQNVVMHYYYHISIRNGLCYRSAAAAVIFEKCLTISRKALAMPEMNTGRIINMVSSDVERINDFMQHCMYLWSSPLQFVISIILLFRLVRWCAFIGVVTLACTLPLQTLVMRKTIVAREKLVKATDARVKATNEFVSGIRIAKFMTWEPRFISAIEEKRDVELKYLRQTQVYRVASSFLNNATPPLMIAAVFVAFSLTGNELTPEIVFPTIALLSILRMPFTMLPLMFSISVQFFVATSRITRFLSCENSTNHVEDIATVYGGKGGAAADAAMQDASITAFVPTQLSPAPKAEYPWYAPLVQNFLPCLTVRPAKRLNVRAADLTIKSTPAANANGAASAKPVSHLDDIFELDVKKLLQDVTLAIPKGKLTVIVGATGSGKSTLLHALLGELELSRGRVWATSSIAYVPQQPWIMNATLRDNVLFFSTADEPRFERALDVCQLRPDLTLLADGVRTEIGEKGINLSGGQKARVSLARAVYADREMYLLDDPLSALDAHVGERVMTDVFLGELAGKTRLLATHHLHFLHLADQVIALGNGTVEFSGTCAAFMATETYKSMMMSSALEHEAAAGEKENADVDADAAEPEAAPSAEDCEKASKEEAEAEKDAKEDAPATSGKLMTTEEKAVGSVPWAMYLEYFRFCGGSVVSLTILAVFTLTEVLTVSSNIWLSVWATHDVTGQESKYLSVYIFLVIAGAACVPFRFSLAFTAMRRGSRNLHKAVLRSVAFGTMEFFDTTPQGRIMNRFSRDMDLADGDLQISWTMFLQFVFSITSSTVVTAASQPLIIFALVPCAFLYYKLMLFYNNANREVRRIGSIAESPMLSLLHESLGGVVTINALQRSHAVMQEALQRLDVVYSCAYAENAFNRWLGIRVEFITSITVAAVALLGVLSTQVSIGSGGVGMISLSLTMALQITSQLNALVRHAAAMEADMNSVERIIYYTNNIDHEDVGDVDACVEHYNSRLAIEDKATHVTIESGSAPSKHALVPDVAAGSMEFRGVQLRYREGLPLVLRDVSFTIAPREKVGIVGRTGSGKSTLLLTFMRLVDICGGEIVVSGRQIRSYGLRELRQLFSMIPQDPVLFDGTVRTNLDPFRESSTEDVWNALELVGMRERVESEASGIDSRVQEGGSNYSVGQRQLLCLARALLKRGSGFILMDEATANIDQALDKQIQNTVMTAFASYTVITIAHRLHTVAHYDTIVVMDHGRVAEVGSPRALIESPTSTFRAMVESMGKKEAELFRRSLV